MLRWLWRWARLVGRRDKCDDCKVAVRGRRIPLIVTRAVPALGRMPATSVKVVRLLCTACHTARTGAAKFAKIKALEAAREEVVEKVKA